MDCVPLDLQYNNIIEGGGSIGPTGPIMLFIEPTIQQHNRGGVYWYWSSWF